MNVTEGQGGRSGTGKSGCLFVGINATPFTPSNIFSYYREWPPSPSVGRIQQFFIGCGSHSIRWGKIRVPSLGVRATAFSQSQCDSS